MQDDAMAGLPFRVVAIPGLVEGGYPGVFRPDPFLLDEERLRLRHPEELRSSRATKDPPEPADPSGPGWPEALLVTGSPRGFPFNGASR